MRKKENAKRDRKKLLFLLVLLLTFGLGLGYAILTQQLTIQNTVNYGSMKWNVGFIEAAGNAGTVTASPSLSSDKKTITVSCDLGVSTKSETCIVDAQFNNDSTFDIKLSEAPIVTYNSTYIQSVLVQDVTDSVTDLTAGYIVSKNAKKTFRITITTKTLTEDLLPQDSLSIPVNVTLNWVENQVN